MDSSRHGHLTNEIKWGQTTSGFMKTSQIWRLVPSLSGLLSKNQTQEVQQSRTRLEKNFEIHFLLTFIQIYIYLNSWLCK